MILKDYSVHSSIRIQSIIILYFGYIIYEHRPNPRLTMKIVQFATPLKKQPIAKERDGLTRECTPAAEKNPTYVLRYSVPREKRGPDDVPEMVKVDLCCAGKYFCKVAGTALDGEWDCEALICPMCNGYFHRHFCEKDLDVPDPDEKDELAIVCRKCFYTKSPPKNVSEDDPKSGWKQWKFEYRKGLHPSGTCANAGEARFMAKFTPSGLGLGLTKKSPESKKEVEGTKKLASAKTKVIKKHTPKKNGKRKGATAGSGGPKPNK
jgi:hypothetical protein